MKYTPENITSLLPDQVFVFGANEKGIHGAGAAKTALRWGAEMGKYGAMGNTYGIPTKDIKIETLPINKISGYVIDFLKYAIANKDKEFLVTKIGCGLAGYKEEEIAPLFQGVIDHKIENVLLPESFYKHLKSFGSFRHFVEIKSNDNCDEIVKKIKFEITSVGFSRLSNGFLAVSVDWSASGPDGTAVKYARQDTQSSSSLLDGWKECATCLRFGDELSYTWETEDGSKIEDFFSIEVGIKYNSSVHNNYEYVCFQNTKWGIVAYFAPWGWNSEREILSQWSKWDDE